MPIRVCIFRRTNRKCYEAQWTDPLTRRKKTRSTGKDRRRDAERFAAKLEQELNDGTFHDDRPITWEKFRERYEADVLPGQALKTQAKTRSTFNAFEKLLGAPKFLASLDAEAIGRFGRLLRENGREEFTVKGHLSALKRILRWAQRMKLLKTLPAIDVPKGVRGMKGRPITLEEFERLLKAVPLVVGDRSAPGFAFLLRGLWLSGLRLGESLRLDWSDDRHLCVDFSGRRPMFRIRSHAEKGRKDRLLPMTPDFAALLAETSDLDRLGVVFPLIPPWADEATMMRDDSVSKLIRRIGKKAGVKVWSGRNGKVKFASAHDLRRSFGFRWSQRVPAATLMLLMRHTSITTTMEFYIGHQAEAAADAIWAAHPDVSANTHAGRVSESKRKRSQVPNQKRVNKGGQRDSNPRPSEPQSKDVVRL